jgi:hypothetical protein
MAFELGWSSQLDERFGFETGDGSRNFPFEADKFGFEVGFMVEKDKRRYFCFYKKKGYRYEDELGLKEIATIPRQWCQKCLLIFLNAYKNNPQAHGITVVAFHPEVFRASYFPQGTDVLF